MTLPLLPLFIFVFRGVLPGKQLTAIESVTFPELMVRMFFGAGLMEELLKARALSPTRSAFGSAFGIAKLRYSFCGTSLGM